MTQMGRWALLDYALYYSKNPAPYLRLGYASIPASWVLINSGAEQSGYGYWYPGVENDGAAGWAFKPEEFGPTWIGPAEKFSQGRGIWRYGGEIDDGFAGTIRGACTAVIHDPLFGRVAYGGSVSESGTHYEVWPRDGVRQRLHLLTCTPALRLILRCDGFSSTAPVCIEKQRRGIFFTIENRFPNPHATGVIVEGLPAGPYNVLLDGIIIEQCNVLVDGVLRIPLMIGEQPAYAVCIWRAF